MPDHVPCDINSCPVVQKDVPSGPMRLKSSKSSVDEMNSKFGTVAMPLTSSREVVMHEGDLPESDGPSSPFDTMEGEVVAMVCPV